MTPLFRPQAVTHATRRLSGEVLLATPPAPRLVALLLAGVTFAAAGFAASASYARKETVSGWLVPDKGLVRITAPGGGVVRALRLREGEVAQAGAAVAELGLSSVTGAGGTAGRVAAALHQEQEAAAAREATALRRLANEAEDLAARAAILDGQRATLRQQEGLLGERLALARQDLARSRDLAERGFLARRELEARRGQALALEQEIAALRGQDAALARDAGSIAYRRASIPNEIDAARADAAAQLAGLRQREAEGAARDVVLATAPVAGRVAALPVSLGQSIAAGGTVAVLAPLDGTLEAELLVPSRAAGFIRPGQAVRLMLHAFPHQRFGAVAATVRSVSATVLAPSEVAVAGLQVREPVFRVRASLSRDSVEAYGERIAMQPGMTLAADVVLDRRSLVAWLFDPIFAVRGR